MRNLEHQSSGKEANDHYEIRTEKLLDPSYNNDIRIGDLNIDAHWDQSHGGYVLALTHPQEESQGGDHFCVYGIKGGKNTARDIFKAAVKLVEQDTGLQDDIPELEDKINEYVENEFTKVQSGGETRYVSPDAMTPEGVYENDCEEYHEKVLLSKEMENGVEVSIRWDNNPKDPSYRLFITQGQEEFLWSLGIEEQEHLESLFQDILSLLEQGGTLPELQSSLQGKIEIFEEIQKTQDGVRRSVNDILEE